MTTVTALPLLTRSFDQIVSDQTATLASSLSSNSVIFDGLNLTAGSPLLALLEANGGVQLLMQYLAYKVLLSTRLATATGDDLDSFGADFLFARYPATPASGYVVVTRATAGGTTYIPLNTLLKSADGSQSYTVIPPAVDPLNQYSAATGYAMLPNIYTISVLVQAVTPGTGGNAAANTITTLSSSSIAILSVTNPSSFFNGADSASDAQYRSAFALYIASRDNGTVAAIRNAIATTSSSYSYAILENYLAFNAPQPGAVAIYFDDGTGFPSQARQVELQNNINAVRAASISYFVIPAAPISVIVQCQTTFASSQTKLANIPVLKAAIAAYINSLDVGQNLVVSALYQVMYNACPSVRPPAGEIFNLTLTAIDQNGRTLENNAYGDVVVTKAQVLRFIQTPPLVNGVRAIQPSNIVIN